MKYSKTVKLKDGRVCVLRNADENDGRAVLDIFKKTHEQTDFLLSYPDEITYTEEEESEYLKNKSESDKNIEILALVDGRAVGTAGIESLGSKYKVAHRADFGISVDKDFWGIGIGSALTCACIECARSAGYRQLELSVVSENTNAIKLYRKVGFVEFGRNPLGFNSRISGYQEILYMRLEL